LAFPGVLPEIVEMNSFSLVAFLGLIACGNGFSISPAARRVEGNLIMRSSTNGDIVSWSKRTAATLTVGAALGGFPLFQGAEIVFAADTPAATVTSTTKATTTVAIPSKTSTTAAPVAKPAPKLPEEIAVETAINKKAADKAKITELQASIKTAKTALNAARVEVNKYAKQVDEVNTKLKNPKIDVDVKKAVVDDKSRLQKLLNEVGLLYQMHNDTCLCSSKSGIICCFRSIRPPTARRPLKR
jgi:hypothetical protein